MWENEAVADARDSVRRCETVAYVKSLVPVPEALPEVVWLGVKEEEALEAEGDNHEDDCELVVVGFDIDREG